LKTIDWLPFVTWTVGSPTVTTGGAGLVLHVARSILTWRTATVPRPGCGVQWNNSYDSADGGDRRS
jgi:hypothetical protein